MEVNDLRISKLRLYLFGILNTLTTNSNYQINANMLSNKVGDYSLDKIPTNTEVEKWIIGVVKRRDVYSFRSRKSYSQDTINNLKNIGFFEEFEKIDAKLYENENKEEYDKILKNIEEASKSPASMMIVSIVLQYAQELGIEIKEKPNSINELKEIIDKLDSKDKNKLRILFDDLVDYNNREPQTFIHKMSKSLKYVSSAISLGLAGMGAYDILSGGGFLTSIRESDIFSNVPGTKFGKPLLGTSEVSSISNRQELLSNNQSNITSDVNSLEPVATPEPTQASVITPGPTPTPGPVATPGPTQVPVITPNQIIQPQPGPEPFPIYALQQSVKNGDVSRVVGEITRLKNKKIPILMDSVFNEMEFNDLSKFLTNFANDTSVVDPEVYSAIANPLLKKVELLNASTVKYNSTVQKIDSILTNGAYSLGAIDSAATFGEETNKKSM